METKRLMVCFAHPDDESFGLGAFLAKCKAEGIETTLICSTNGDAGTVSAERLNGHGSVAALRVSELECAAQVLGLHEVIRFGYRDSGMMGSPDNNHAQALWAAPLEEVAGRIADEIRRVRPQVIVTFDPYGGYGHPDHIKMHQATHAAWEMLKGDANAPRRLYYTTFPRGIVRLGVFLLRLTGRDPRRQGVNKDLDFQAVLDAATPIHARVDVDAFFEVGMQAAACHASQGNPRESTGVGRRIMRRLSHHASFTRAIPAPVPGSPIERDLFAGLNGG